MNIQEMKEKKKEKGYTNEQIAELSGVPLGTVQKIFGGATTSPRYDTLKALEKIFLPMERERYYASVVKDASAAYTVKRQGEYTVEDYYALPDEQRAELIDGRMYMMAPPSRKHQRISIRLVSIIDRYIEEHKGKCEVYAAPFAVYLDERSNTYVEPDISVICDPDKLDDRGCKGAPDWIIEIVSPASKKMDYLLKLLKYRSAGVKEYWIVDPEKNRVIVYNFTGDESVNDYTLQDFVKVGIYEDFVIDFGSMEL